ncbi:MAG: MBL fold metallo-hydrolase [Clostridia bacterium]|nr:MBL fold metallo-hydrolase [Clostridia bacterium]
MKIERLPLGHIAANCYMISTENSAVVIDCGTYSDSIFDFLDKSKDKERLILLTHMHFDHIGGAPKLREKTGVKIAVGEIDAPYLKNPEFNLSNRFHAHVEPFEADIKLTDGQEIKIGDITVKAIKTSGHTKGGMCYLAEDNLFSGDTLFFETVGATDFEGGNMRELINSIKKLLQLGDNVKVFPGHGEATTIGHEKRYNMFLGNI